MEEVQVLQENTETKGNESKETLIETKDTPDVSEYDSADSYSEEEDNQNNVRSRGSVQGSQSESDAEGVTIPRESGDGQESAPLKKVDDDEDKKNPQYIPKRGTFYEHDDRTAEDIEGTEIVEPEKTDKDGKKKVWQDKKEKWSHDKFNDSDQAPKSKQELISIYGYDIRNEDGPPRARRRRRYGRGPNKYTRNWEDEDAYNKKPPVPRAKKPDSMKENDEEEFPPLENNAQRHSPNDRNQINSQIEREQNNRRSAEKNRSESSIESNSNSNLSVNQQTPTNRFVKTEIDANVSFTNTNQQEYQNKNQRVGSGRVIKPQKEIKDSDYKGFTTKTRQYRNMKMDQKILPKTKKEDVIQSQNFTNKNNRVHDVENDMSKLSLQDAGHSTKGNKYSNNNSNRQGSVPPRLQGDQQKGSKRYSSLRQRSLPETANPPFPPHANYYSNDFSQNNQPQTTTQGIIHQGGTLSQGVPQIPPPPLQLAPQQVPVTAAAILQAPPQFGAPPPFTQTPFLQPGVAPGPFIAPQGPILNYVPTQPQYLQGYQQQFTPVVTQSLNILETQPTELYQPQGGITYYSTDQQIAQRSVPLKRPKAAIPIVAPPPSDERGRQKFLKDDDSSSSSSLLTGAEYLVSENLDNNNSHNEDTNLVLAAEQ